MNIRADLFPIPVSPGLAHPPASRNGSKRQRNAPKIFRYWHLVRKKRTRYKKAIQRHVFAIVFSEPPDEATGTPFQS
jgi:hypothetical protein